MRPQHPGVSCTPGAIRLEIFPLPPVRVVDATVQDQLRGAALNSRKRNVAQQRNRIVVALPPWARIEIAKQRDRIVIPTPPQIARQGPQALLHRSDEAVETS